MSLHLVIDPTARPARFGRAAALEASRLGARFLHRPAAFDLASHPDAAQYVYAAGGLGPSGLFFAERILGRPIEAAVDEACILSAAQHGCVVVPIHPAFGQDHASLRMAAHRAGIPVDEGAPDEAPDAAEARTDPAVAPSAATVLIIGREHDHFDVYPAALVSLLDAAQAIGTSIRVAFARPDLDTDILTTANGIVLPGGSDMGNVPAQIRAAHYALANRVPILGLCLGMQTMTTAFAQRELGDQRISLAEADPDAPLRSFVPMTANAALPRHRTGDAVVDVVPGTPLARLLGGTSTRIRCNHRYHLTPDLRGRLEQLGLTTSATSFGGRVVDAVEWPAHPFFVGFQGHPELGAPAGVPHPVFPAFLEAASDHARTAIREIIFRSK